MEIKSHSTDEIISISQEAQLTGDDTLTESQQIQLQEIQKRIDARRAGDLILDMELKKDAEITIRRRNLSLIAQEKITKKNRGKSQ